MRHDLFTVEEAMELERYIISKLFWRGGYKVLDHLRLNQPKSSVKALFDKEWVENYMGDLTYNTEYTEEFQLYIYVKCHQTKSTIERIELSFDYYFGVYWKDKAILQVVLNYLVDNFGYYKVLPDSEGIIFEFETQDLLLQLLYRNEDAIKNYFFPYKISMINNLN